MEIISNIRLPLRKQGAAVESVFGTIGSGLFGLGSSVLQQDANWEMQQSTLNAQRLENQRNREFNAAEAEKSRQFTDEQRLASQQYQTEQWQREFDIQNAYNTPKAQSQRLLSAGINPAVYFSGSGSVAASSSPSVSAPSGAGSSPASSNGSLNVSPPYLQNIPQLLSSAGDMVASLANAGKTNQEAKYLASTMADRIATITEQLGIAKDTKEAQYLENEFKRAKLPYAAQSAYQEYMSLSLQNYVALKTGQKFDKEADLIDAQKRVQDALEKMHTENAMLLKVQWTQLQASFADTLKNLRADTANKLASAELSHEQAVTEKLLRPLREVALNRQNKLTDEQIRNVDWNNKNAAIKALRDLLGFNDNVWNDIWNQFKSNYGANHGNIIDWLEANGVELRDLPNSHGSRDKSNDVPIMPINK